MTRQRNPYDKLWGICPAVKYFIQAMATPKNYSVDGTVISDFGNHNAESENSTRSLLEKPYGGSEIVSHRLKASANSLEGPEICVASSSA